MSQPLGDADQHDSADEHSRLESPSEGQSARDGHPILLLRDRLRASGVNDTSISASDVNRISTLRSGGLELRFTEQRGSAVVRWRMFGDALIVRAVGAEVALGPTHGARDGAFYLAYAPQRPTPDSQPAPRRLAALIDASTPARVPWTSHAPTTLVGIARSPFEVPLTAWQNQPVTVLSPQRLVTLPPILDFVEPLSRSQRTPNPREQMRIGDILTQMITHLALSTWDEHALPQRGAESYITTAALSYISQYYTDSSLSPQRTAEALGISVRTLQTAFSAIGTTPASEIASCRLNHAARCLADHTFGGLTVTQIARHAGFANTDTFRRAFHRRFGQSPVEYRRAQNPLPRQHLIDA